MEKPIIFLAFANDKDDYLSMINRERKNIQQALRRHDDEGLIKVETESASTIEDIFHIFNTYQDQIVIFHYGGHAGGTHLQLEHADTGAQAAQVGGLAQLLGQQQNLQLVFLNGCSTKAQVELLLKQGVKIVIATSVPIDDKVATEFAEQFYNSLASHTPIQRAFLIAKAFVETKYQTADKIGIYRDLVMNFEETAATDEMPWGLFVNPEADKSLEWALPKQIYQKQVIKNRFDYETKPNVNDDLIDILCEDVALYNKDLDKELNKEELDIPSIKREIVDSFPTPIGEQLRKLFTLSNNPDKPDEMELFTLARLEQLALTHRTSVQFICYILLSQLWDENKAKDEFNISDDHIVNFNSFFAMDQGTFRSFDFVRLISTITEVFGEFDIPFFIEELKDLQAEVEKNNKLYEAYIFMNAIYEDLLDEKVPTDQVENLCLAAESHLGLVLKSIAFLVKYKLVTIKNIEIIKNRHESPRYLHSHITLNRALTVASTGVTEIGKEFNNFTDNKSVIFIKTENNEVSDFLNLTPFVIDENALSSNHSSKLFLFAYQSEKGYCYQFLNNLHDSPLEVLDENYPNVKNQFDRFQAEIFGEEYISTVEEEVSTGKSRFSRKR